MSRCSTTAGSSYRTLYDELNDLLNRRVEVPSYPNVIPSDFIQRGIESEIRQSERMASTSKFRTLQQKNLELEKLLEKTISEHEKIVAKLNAKIESLRRNYNTSLEAEYNSNISLRDDVRERLSTLDKELKELRSARVHNDQSFTAPNSASAEYEMPAHNRRHMHNSHSNAHQNTYAPSPSVQPRYNPSAHNDTYSPKRAPSVHSNTYTPRSHATPPVAEPAPAPAAPAPTVSNQALDRIMQYMSNMEDNLNKRIDSIAKPDPEINQMFNRHAQKIDELNTRLANRENEYESVLQKLERQLHDRDVELLERISRIEQQTELKIKQAYSHPQPTYTEMDTTPSVKVAMPARHSMSTPRSSSSLSTSTLPDLTPQSSIDSNSPLSAAAQRIEKLKFDLQNGNITKEQFNHFANIYNKSDELLRNRPDLLAESMEVLQGLKTRLGRGHAPVLDAIKMDL